MNALHTPVAEQLLMSIWVCSLIICNNNELIYFSTNEKGIGYVKIIASHIEPRKSVGLFKKKKNNKLYQGKKRYISLIYFIFFYQK